MNAIILIKLYNHPMFAMLAQAAPTTLFHWSPIDVCGNESH